MTPARDGVPVYTDLIIRAQPGASRERIVGVLGDALKVAVSAPPEKGKANEAIERLLASQLGLSNSAVRVVAGETSRRKTVRIIGMSPVHVKQRLERIIMEIRD
jgi:hypothetical protein